jgi:FxsC-like protein
LLYFFLSYAREDTDEFVEGFFRDLSGEVRGFAGLGRHEEVGFLDKHSIELGARWPSRLVRALSDCRCFLALCSPRYFVSEACGKEWAVFEDRLRQYEHGAESPPVLVPVLWLPTRRMPDIALGRQYEIDVLGDAYSRDGLRQLMRLQRNRDAYLNAVSVLARHIVDHSDRELPPYRGRMAFEQIPNAFQREPEALDGYHNNEEVPAPERRPAEATSRYVHFVVAAPTRERVASTRLRRDTSYYGEQPPDWAPYRPEPSGPIAEHARLIAADQSFESAVAGIEDLPERLEFAKRNNQLVVFLVDAWATKLSDHRQALLNCDRLHGGEPATAVMVPASHHDPETIEHWTDLSNRLKNVLPNRFSGGDYRMFRHGIVSDPAFAADLRVALSTAQNRVLVRGTPRQPLPPDPVPKRPILRLPELPD